MTLSRIDLESFDDGTSIQPKESAEYKRGFEAGAQAAQESETARMANAIENVSATLSDMVFGYAEARIQLLERVRPLLSQIADLILPSVAQESFSAHVVDVIHGAFDQVSDQPLKISVHPDIVAPLSEALSEQGTDFVFVGDEKLVAGQALLRNEHTQILIDLPALMEALQMALNGLEPLERSFSNG